MATYHSQNILVPTASPKAAKHGAATRYAKAVVYSISGAAVSRLIIFVQAVFIARLLGAELYGVFSVVTGAATLMTSFAGFSLGFALTKFLPENLNANPKRAESILLHCVMAAVASAVLMSLGFFLLSPVLAGSIYHRVDLTRYFKLSSLLVLVLAFFNLSGAILIGFQRFKDYAWRISLGYACQLVAVWIGGTLFSLAGILIGLVIGPILGSVILLKGGSNAAREYGLKLHWNAYRWSWPVMRSILNFSIPSQIAGFLATPVLWVVTTILSLKKGFVEVGLFSAAFVFYQAILFIAQSFSAPALPVLSEIRATADQALFNRALNANLRASWSLTLPLCFLAATLGKTIVLLVYGTKYLGAGTMIFFTSFSAFWFVMFCALSVAITSLGKMWDILFFYAFWSAIVTALSWKFSAVYGSMGVAAAYFMSYLLLMMMTFAYSAWRFGFRYKDIGRMSFFSIVSVAIANVIAFHSSRASSWALSAILTPTLIWAEWKLMLNEEDHHFIESSIQSLTAKFFFKNRHAEFGPE